MSLSEAIEKNQKIVIPVAIGVLLLAALLFLLNRGGSGSTAGGGQDKWMFDLNAKVLRRAPATIEGPSDQGDGTFNYGGLGTAGSTVDAILTTCEDPAAITSGMSLAELGQVGGQVWYLARNTPAGDDQAIADATGAKWFPMDSGPGLRIQESGLRPCPDGNSPKRARP